MPRIDPERLLKTLAPLLEGTTGAIKSDHEVDKIYGLMSKYSKKLVSKCTYINILQSTPLDILDQFLSRGGWDMICNWTADAVPNNNYELLKELCSLLLYAPATVQRLKANELPKLVKSLSRDCQCPEVREAAKQIVTKWISVAKNQDSHKLNSSFPLGDSGVNPNSVNNLQVPVQSCSVTSSKVCGPGDSEPLGDLGDIDLSSADLSAMMDFNPDVFSKVVDQHLDEVVASGNAIVHSIDNANIDSTADSIKIELNSQDQAVITNLVLQTQQESVEVEVQDTSIYTKPNEGPYCIMKKDGKSFLVRLKLASPQELALQEISSTSEEQLPKQQTTIARGTDEKHTPAILKKVQKTYSKKTPEVVPSTDRPSKDAPKSEKTSRSKGSDSSGSSKKKSSSKSAAAAAAEKKLEEDAKLKEKIKQEKANVKKRAQDAARQKQVDKDQETLKKLNLTREPSVINPPNKIPKIPKRQSSFADAIGIPGSSEPEKTVKKKSSMENLEQRENSTPKIKSESESKSSSSSRNDKDKERRNKPKVFQSKSSRNDELLKDMAETIKSKPNKSSSSNKATDSGVVGEKSVTGNSLVVKPEKRPSIDSIEKPGEVKKAKLGNDQSEKKDSRSQAKDKKQANASKSYQESSLFMDALNASYDTQKPSSKRKRRLSSSTNDKEKESTQKSGKATNSVSKEKAPSPPPTSSEPTSQSPGVVKPAFNFYRETLEDKEEPSSKDEETEEVTTPVQEEPMDVAEGRDESNSTTEDDDVPFIPTEEELALKSVLVIHRSRNKPKKAVRFKEEEELVETFFFELDEDERVNVTRHKDFSTMKDQEKAEEKFRMGNSLRQKSIPEEADEAVSWRKPIPLLVTPDKPTVNSTERMIQEERERLNLALFLPPGLMLPETPVEPDPSSPADEDSSECRTIPMDDVPGVTKVYNKGPFPRVTSDAFGAMMSHSIIHPTHPPFGFSSGSLPFNEMNVGPPMQSPGIQGYSSAPSTMDFNNPWNIGAPSNPALGVATNVNDIPIGGFPNLNSMGLPSGPITFPPPNMATGFGFAMQGNMPSMTSQFPANINFSVPPTGNMMPMENNRNHMTNNQRGGARGGPSRDYGDRDLRRPPFGRDSRDQDSRRDYGYESNRGRASRNDGRSTRDYDRRDRDRRSPSPRRRRDDRDRQDRDYRDYRGRPRTGKKDIPCRYFKQGHCTNGSRCDFSHDVNNSSEIRHSRQETPRYASNNHTAQSEENWEDDNNMFERRKPSEIPDDFADTPSSPTNELHNSGDPGLLSAKIIPVE